MGATATANTIVGFVIGATITSGGSGYTSAPEVTISGNGTGASATATLTDGVVTGINIVSAGSGYTTGATITIAPPVIPFRVEYASGTITATYASAPTAGKTIAATYRYGTGGIADALGNASEHWMAVTVDGVSQGARQRVLAVPFAQRAGHAKSVDETGLYASTDSISSMLDEIALNGATSSLHRLVSVKDNQNALILNSLGIPWESGKGLLLNPPKISVSGYAGWESKLMATISNINSKVSKVKYTASTSTYSGHTEIVIFYQDGTNTGIGGQGGLYSNSYIEIVNPNPDKTVSKIEYRGGNNQTGGGPIVFTDATFEFAGNDLSFSVSIAQPLIGSEFVVYLDQGLLTSNANVKASYTIRSGSSSFGPYSFGEKITLSTQQTIDGINVFFNGNFAAGSSPVTKVLLRKIR
jgi:hypothetical protein